MKCILKKDFKKANFKERESVMEFCNGMDSEQESELHD